MVAVPHHHVSQPARSAAVRAVVAHQVSSHHTKAEVQGGTGGGVPIVLSRVQADLSGSCRRRLSTSVPGGGSSQGTRSRMMAHVTLSPSRATALGSQSCRMPPGRARRSVCRACPPVPAGESRPRTGRLSGCPSPDREPWGLADAPDRLPGGARPQRAAGQVATGRGSLGVLRCNKRCADAAR